MPLFYSLYGEALLSSPCMLCLVIACTPSRDKLGISTIGFIQSVREPRILSSGCIKPYAATSSAVCLAQE